MTDSSFSRRGRASTAGGLRYWYSSFWQKSESCDGSRTRSTALRTNWYSWLLADIGELTRVRPRRGDLVFATSGRYPRIYPGSIAIRASWYSRFLADIREHRSGVSTTAAIRATCYWRLLADIQESTRARARFERVGIRRFWQISENIDRGLLPDPRFNQFGDRALVFPASGRHPRAPISLPDSVPLPVSWHSPLLADIREPRMARPLPTVLSNSVLLLANTIAGPSAQLRMPAAENNVGWADETKSARPELA